MKNKNLKAKILRFLGITKPIELNKYDRMWILLCKGHYKERYDYSGNWTDLAKPLFVEIYGWDPDEDYRGYLNCLFNKLLELYFKIQDDKSGHRREIKEIFNVSFYKSVSRDQDLPIERAIGELCGTIQMNTVIENGVYRYYL